MPVVGGVFPSIYWLVEDAGRGLGRMTNFSERKRKSCPGWFLTWPFVGKSSERSLASRLRAIGSAKFGKRAAVLIQFPKQNWWKKKTKLVLADILESSSGMIVPILRA
jgi:hypothetical protein